MPEELLLSPVVRVVWDINKEGEWCYGYIFFKKWTFHLLCWRLKEILKLPAFPQCSGTLITYRLHRHFRESTQELLLLSTWSLYIQKAFSFPLLSFLFSILYLFMQWINTLLCNISVNKLAFFNRNILQ